ncbi:MAG: hypothetical protein Q9224_000086 [Gallowayella concinna]
MLSRPFRSPLLKRPGADGNEGPPAKRVKIQAVDTARLVFKQPGISSIPRQPLQQIDKIALEDDGAGTQGYYNVLWRKVTAKKHKTFQGDALLYIGNDGFAELHDGETSKSMGKAKCHEPLLPGSPLFIAGKEIEVEQVLSRAQYLARRQLSTSKDGREKKLERKENTPAIKSTALKVKQDLAASTEPRSTLKLGSRAASVLTAPIPTGQDNKNISHRKIQTSAIQYHIEPPPRYVVYPSDALVMKRPSNAKTDVVVDPLLSTKLRDHQREGVKFMYECVMGLRDFNGQGAILADEMGLGKTLQTIALLWTLLKQSPYGNGPVIRKALIVCPATLINNWRKEIKRWLGLDRIGVLVAGAKTRISHFTHGKSYNIIIVGYERLRTIHTDLAKGQGVDIIVADEAHRLKTAKNKSLLAIKNFPTPMRIFLTGTPVQNDLSEFYMMVDSVNPGVLSTLKSFTRDLENPIARGRQPGASSEDVERGEDSSRELARLTSPFILRRTAEVLAKYLPAKTEHVLFCKPTQAQAAVYRHVLSSPTFHAAAAGNSESSLQLITLLKKVCNSPSLLRGKVDPNSGPDGTVDNAALASIPAHLLRGNAGSTKLRMLDQLLHVIRTTTAEKVVLVSNYTSTLNLLSNLLTSVGHRFTRMDGTTPSNKRQEIIDDFNRTSAEDCFAFLLSAKTGGLGINLIGASRLVLFDVDWNPATDVQAMARIHRDGQKRSCFIYRFLMAGGMDEKIWQRQVTKLGLASNIVDQKEETSNFTREDLKDLFRLDEGPSCQTHDLIGCRCEGRGSECLDIDYDDADAEAELPSVSALVKAIEPGQQVKQVKAATRAARDTLMAYTHVDCSDFASGMEEDKAALIKDDVLLETLKDEGNSISFLFSKTSA